MKGKQIRARKMWRTVIILFLSLMYACMLVWSAPEGPKCKYWKQLASNLSHLHQLPYGTKLYMQCDAGCSNITCSGNLQQFGIFPSMSISVDICFGVMLNHCQDPVAMQYYLDLIYGGNAKQNVHKVGNITHNDTYEVPVPADLPIAVDVKLIVFIELVPVSSSNYVNFKITGKVRIMEGNTPFFPYQTAIIPETLIDVPNCPTDRSLLKDFKPPQTCKAPPFPNATHSTTEPPKINSKTYHQSCELGLGQCVKNEMCQATGDSSLSRHGICECIPEASVNPATGYCAVSHVSTVTKAIMTTVLPTMKTGIPVPGVTDASSSLGKNKHLIFIIVGSVGGVVAIIALGILMIIFIGRRKRIAHYRDRQQLLSDDMMDEEDDTNVTM